MSKVIFKDNGHDCKSGYAIVIVIIVSIIIVIVIVILQDLCQ
jgi:hypothetical protein